MPVVSVMRRDIDRSMSSPFHLDVDRSSSFLSPFVLVPVPFHCTPWPNISAFMRSTTMAVCAGERWAYRFTIDKVL